MYRLFVKIFSYFPEPVWDFFEWLFSTLKYCKYIYMVKNELINSENPEIQDYGRKISLFRFFGLYNEPWKKKYRKKIIDIQQDDVGHFFLYKNCKMYLPVSWTKTRCKVYIRSILLEQDNESPHLYINDLLKKKNSYGTVIDIGGAEGNFTLDIIDKSKKIFIFECDNIFINVLQKTMEPYKSKISIVSKFVGKQTNNQENMISLDDFFEKNMPKDVGLIKMDIEGAEQDAIIGMKKLLCANPQAILLICAYHDQDAEEDIKTLLPEYSSEHRDGWLLVPSMGKQEYPYVRRGVLELRKS